MRAAVYARVSTDSNGQSPECSSGILEDTASGAAGGSQTIASTVDVAISGTKEKRSGLSS